MTDWKLFLEPPYTLAWVGMVFLFLGLLYMDMGKARLRYGAWVYRDKDPKAFWWNVASLDVCGLGLIVYFFYLQNSK